VEGHALGERASFETMSPKRGFGEDATLHPARLLIPTIARVHRIPPVLGVHLVAGYSRHPHRTPLVG
jgi:hypothetical protein